MESNLKLEVFASDREVQECSFHIYDLISSNLAENSFKVIRGACRKLGNYNTAIGIFENGKQIIATAEIKNLPDNLDFEIKYQGQQTLPLQNNKKIYEQYIRFIINEKLRTVKVLDKYRKYSCKTDISSSWFPDGRGGYTTYECADKSIRLERGYKLRVEIGRDNRAYLWLDTKSIFTSKLNIMDLINKGFDVSGMQVKNDWASFRQSGVITDISDKAVADQLDWGQSLKSYYTDVKKEAYRVKDISDETPVVYMKLARGSDSLPYYPQALVPIITREYMAQYDPAFSNRIDNLVKRTMVTRLALDAEFISDIGELDEVGGISFETSCCDPRYIGFKWGNVRLPQLVCGDGRTLAPGNEYQIFNHGFYQKPNKQIKIGYLYPRGEDELLKQIANDIYSFAALGKYHGQEDKYIKKD